ncbi:hypothetical protein FRC17_011324 [Serendipita sp. 399]|nr:hypothetical protein FRC17_011324 [Serendipita sp. 399]
MNLNCVVLDSKFHLATIMINATDTLEQLQHKIKEKYSPWLNHVPAPNLDLYAVKIPIPSHTSSTVAEIVAHPATYLENGVLLDPLEAVAERFPDIAHKEVHIIVQLPIHLPPNQVSMDIKRKLSSSSGFGRTSVARPQSSRADEEIKALIDSSVPFLQTVFSAYLSNDIQLPLWQVQQGSDEMRRHIANLNLPALTFTASFPSLLLHNLGQPSHDPLLANRVNRIFLPHSGLRFLCNTSGSGKTRLLLEGLWRDWGFYFTAYNGFDHIGSSDFGRVLADMEASLTRLTEDNYAMAHAQNRILASRHLHLLLYVRILAFRIYLECASALPGGITEAHKGRWTLLQVAPEILLRRNDVFHEQFEMLKGASRDLLDVLIVLERRSIEKLLGPVSIFCVLDEAQVPANKLADRFRSDTDPAIPRSVLRQVIHEWVQSFPDLIISGTGVSMKEMQTALGSTVAKEGGLELEMMTDLGAFDNEEDQQTYLKQYLPSGFLDTASGQTLASRVGYWLRGRHRFTATYLSHLIRNAFESPHVVLNDLVHNMTGFRPKDIYGDPPLIAKLPKPRGFDFSNLLDKSTKESDLLPTVAFFVFEYTFTGKIRGLGGSTGERMVEYGVSRFKRPSESDSGIAETDEPLAILGLVKFLEQQNLRLERYLMEALNTANPSARGFAFEPFGAYLLARAFSSPRPLSEVFEFVRDCKLQEETAELVALEQFHGSFSFTPLNIKSDVRSTHVLGYSPLTADETLKWLQNPQGSAFCFPPSAIGPDLIFVLRLTRDGTFLRVCVQFKHTKKLDSVETAKAIRTTDPNNCLSELKDDEWTTSDPVMRQEMIKAVQTLGTGTKKAGRCGVLRVVFSHPSQPDVTVLESAAKDDPGHPLATVPIGNLEHTDSALGQSILSLATSSLTNPGRKRKRAEESTGVQTGGKKKPRGT